MKKPYTKLQNTELLVQRPKHTGGKGDFTVKLLFFDDHFSRGTNTKLICWNCDKEQVLDIIVLHMVLLIILSY